MFFKLDPFNMYCPIIRSLADPGANEVAITIDDGPNSCTTLALLDLLDEHKGKATFFLSGFRAIKNPELVEEIVEQQKGKNMKKSYEMVLLHLDNIANPRTRIR